jgi:TolB-like protein
MSDSLERLNAALVDRYRLERELGAGGMATVYLAEDLKHHRHVAIKVLRPELSAVLGAERFLREIRVTANLQHPRILPLYDSGDAGGSLFYVMPLVSGESLRDRLTRERQLPVEETIRIIQQVAGALDFAHRQGIIHRDIKPENILLHDGEALLSDFGIAIGLAEAGAARLTGTGLSIGTPQYMSPEQATGERDLDARSDVFALGAVAYEMLTGEPPAAGKTAGAVIAKLVTERPTPVKTLREGVPAALEAAVMRALAKSPADRFPSARAFADALTAPVARAVGPRRRRAIAYSAVGFVAVLALVWFGLVRRPSSGTGAASAPGAIRSIAVLPFGNYSGDSSQDYFAEGMTDELTTTLASITQLRVTSRGSAMQFAGRNRPPTPEIAKVLQVDALVEGSVARSGDEVRITAQLIDARGDHYLWARSFERQTRDVLALQAEVATAIAREIDIHLTETERTRFAAAPSVNPAAHDAYLRGRYYFNRPSDENLKKAIAEFGEAARLSPDFAPAYSGLSDEGVLTASEGKARAREAAERAVQLDSTSAEAHTSLAVFKLFYELDWEGCEREFRRAIALNPSYAFAHDQFALALAFTGRFEESVAESERAQELDPLSPQVLIDAAMAPIFQKRFAAAGELTRRASELDPTFFFPVMIDGWIELEQGRAREAIPLLERATTMGAPPFAWAFLAYAYGAAGDRTKALAQVERLRSMAPDGRVPPFSLALVSLGLGEKRRALDNLELAVAANSQWLGWLGRDALFDPLRTEPRFQALLRRLNLTS